MLNLIDEHTRECLLVRPERRWSSPKVIEALADVARRRFISSPAVHGSTAIARASTRKLRDEFLNGEIFYSLKEVLVLAEEAGCVECCSGAAGPSLSKAVSQHSADYTSYRPNNFRSGAVEPMEN